MIYRPERHQQLAGEFCEAHPRCGLFLQMGLGKTVVTLTAIYSKLYDEFSIRKALVIAPLNVARDTWSREAAKWDHLSGLRLVRMLGTEKARLEALNADADVYVINRENVVWLIEYLTKERRPWPFDAVVIDELSSFKSATSKRFRALKKVIKQAKVVIGLTGTPAPNGYIDLWPQVYLLDGGERLGRTLGEFRNRYFSPGAHKGHIVYEWKLKPGAKEQIDAAISDICLSMKAEDWVHLPDIIYREFPVTMSDEERKVYDYFQRERVLPLLGDAISDPEHFTSLVAGDTAAIAANKLLQMANGDVYDDQGGVFHIHNRKLDALEDIVEAANGEPVLVFYAYKPGAAAIRARFPDAVQLGDCGMDTSEVISRWNAGKIPILLCHPASAGHGLNLQEGGHIVVWFGLPWSLELYQQANARLHRMGQTRAVVVEHIICTDTVDQRVLDALQRKDATQNALLDALNLYINKTGKENHHANR
jgi:SNF2 family DNA or RNA helicase